MGKLDRRNIVRLLEESVGVGIDISEVKVPRSLPGVTISVGETNGECCKEPGAA